MAIDEYDPAAWKQKCTLWLSWAEGKTRIMKITQETQVNPDQIVSVGDEQKFVIEYEFSQGNHDFIQMKVEFDIILGIVGCGFAVIFLSLILQLE